MLPPCVDHQGEETAVLIGAHSVSLSLIPNGATNAVANNGVKNPIKEIGWAVIAPSAVPWCTALRPWLSVSKPFFVDRHRVS